MFTGNFQLKNKPKLIPLTSFILDCHSHTVPSLYARKSDSNPTTTTGAPTTCCNSITQMNEKKCP